MMMRIGDRLVDEMVEGEGIGDSAWFVSSG